MNRTENKECVEADHHKWKVFICKKKKKKNKISWGEFDAVLEQRKRKHNFRLFTTNGAEKINLRYRKQRSFYSQIHCYNCVCPIVKSFLTVWRNVYWKQEEEKKKLSINKWNRSRNSMQFHGLQNIHNASGWDCKRY